MTRNPKKIRQRLNAGVCNLEVTGFKQLSKRQQRKITMFCLQLAQEDDPTSYMVNQHNRRNSAGAVRVMDLVSSIESMVDRVE